MTEHERARGKGYSTQQLTLSGSEEGEGEGLNMSAREGEGGEQALSPPLYSYRGVCQRKGKEALFPPQSRGDVCHG